MEFPEGMTKPSSGFVGVGTAVENGKGVEFGEGRYAVRIQHRRAVSSEGICGEHGSFENGLCRCDYGFPGKLCVMWRKPWSLAPTIVRIRAIVSRVKCRCNPGYARAIVRSDVRRVVTLEGDV